MDSIYLVGSEDVRAAGNTISGAADTMRQAANNISGSMEEHQRFMTNWLQGLREIMEK